MQVPAAGAGKIAVGQRVNIRLDNYPYMEYGLLEGVVSGISDVPEQGSYFVTIAFPEGLVTSYGQALAFNRQMTGTAEIITHDIRLFQRIMQPLRHILTSKT
jgi:HlyD family secretion protein